MWRTEIKQWVLEKNLVLWCKKTKVFVNTFEDKKNYA